MTSDFREDNKTVNSQSQHKFHIMGHPYFNRHLPYYYPFIALARTELLLDPAMTEGSLSEELNTDEEEEEQEEGEVDEQPILEEEDDEEEEDSVQQRRALEEFYDQCFPIDIKEESIGSVDFEQATARVGGTTVDSGGKGNVQAKIEGESHNLPTSPQNSVLLTGKRNREEEQEDSNQEEKNNKRNKNYEIEELILEQFPDLTDIPRVVDIKEEYNSDAISYVSLDTSMDSRIQNKNPASKESEKWEGGHFWNQPSRSRIVTEYNDQDQWWSHGELQLPGDIYIFMHMFDHAGHNLEELTIHSAFTDEIRSFGESVPNNLKHYYGELPRSITFQSFNSMEEDGISEVDWQSTQGNNVPLNDPDSNVTWVGSINSDLVEDHWEDCTLNPSDVYWTDQDRLSK
jgi:hypothetical protein